MQKGMEQNMSEKTVIRQFIIDNFLFGSDDGLQDSDQLRQKGIIDSTGVLELIAFVEKTFELSIDDREIIPENLDTIERIADFVQAKKSGGNVHTLELEYGEGPEMPAAQSTERKPEAAAAHA
jgi:acyl carrier protein